MVALGGMCGFIWGACVVLFGGHGFIWGGVHGFFSFFGYNEIRSMSRQYASYWNAFLLLVMFEKKVIPMSSEHLISWSERLLGTCPNFIHCIYGQHP